MQKHGKYWAKRRNLLKTTASITTAGLIAGCLGGNQPADGSQETPSNQQENQQPGGETDYPQRDITFIIPYSTGGGFDTYSRLTTRHITKYLPDEVDILPRNITGGSGIVGTERGYNSEPDGYTVFTFSNFTQLFNQIVRDVNYDLTNVTQLPQYTTGKRAIVTGTNSGLKTWDETVTAIQNGDVKIGTTTGLGVGLIIAAIAAKTDLFTIDEVVNSFVPFPGGTADILAGVKRGNIQATANTYSSGLPYIKSGDYRVVLMCTMSDEVPEELMQYQDVKPETFKTAGVPNGEVIQDMIQMTRFFGGPPGIPEVRANILREAITKTLHDEEFLADAKKADRPIVYADSETAAQVVNNSFENWSQNKDLLNRMAGLGK